MKLKSFLLAGLALLTVGCSKPKSSDPLPSWNETPIKQQLLDYLDVQVEKIPVEDRIAVFDMDGTIMCESPLWCEMAVAVQKMVDLQQKNPELKKQIPYQYAEKLSKNPADTSVLNNWFIDDKNYLDTLIQKAFVNVDHEDYVAYANKFLKENNIYKYDIKYAESFYQPMLELIKYMKEKKFEIYLVSGSMQGLVWSVAPEVTGLDRQHLIGTLQATEVTYPTDGEASFKIQGSILDPKNNKDGKSINIYNRLGKVPVMAVGNTTGDFGMFRLASTSRHPHLALMINHDDAEREFKYPPYHGAGMPGWQDTLKVHNWLQADMSKEFKTVWMTKK